nr:energy transducer TonB [Capnocytophaga periodontitidis]
MENTLKYPTEAKEVGIEGKVNVSFRIKKDGNTEVIGLRGVDKVLEQEAKRIIESMPKLIPAKDKDGKPTEVAITYPINFNLL